MRKSTIPFIFENLSLNNIFIEASGKENMSQMFFLQKMTLEDLETNKYNIIIIDKPSLHNFLNQKIKINKIFVIDDFDKVKNDLKYNEEIVKINLPFRMGDIFQRIENNLIQVNINSERLMKYNKFTYDPLTRELSNQLLSLRFTEKEGEIFAYLLNNGNSYISKKELLRNIWSYAEGIDTHTLETHVYALRKKVEKKFGINRLILSEEKKGYYLNESIL